MKKISIIASVLAAVVFLAGCKKDDNYPGHVLSSYIGIMDIRDLYKGKDITLTRENMFGGKKIAGLVVSDHSGHNLPEGLLIVQDRYRLGFIRGISIALDAAATNYAPGDSVIIDVEGAALTKVDGILQLKNIAESKISKISSGNAIPLNKATTAQILSKPDNYESVLSVIVKAGFNPLPTPADVYAGDKVLNDGFGDIKLHTEAAATFANDNLPISANFYGIFLNKAGANNQVEPQFRMRTGNDVTVLSSTIQIPSIVITGFMADPQSTDADYEYIQLMATRDIDFAVTPFAIVTTNNAGASTPTGNPVNGWATGGLRTYKLNLTSGTVTKGTFFYVGGTTKTINGNGSTSIASSNWVKSYNYSTIAGEDFGKETGNLLANSGNSFGMCVFEGTTVDASSTPIDVIFISSGGTLYSAGPPAVGYRIANTDFYDIKNPITLEDQPFYRSGTNTLFFAYGTANSNDGSGKAYFQMLGGEYNVSLGKWTKARTQRNIELLKDSPIAAIEAETSTKIIF